MREGVTMPKIVWALPILVVVFYASLIWIEYDKGQKMKELHEKHNAALIEMILNR